MLSILLINTSTIRIFIGFANGGHEEGSSSESSDGSDSSSDDSDIPDSQGNIASFVIQDNEEEAERVLAQIPGK